MRLAVGPSVLAALFLTAGCGGGEEAREKLPRPVTTFALRDFDPRVASTIAGSVSSWKTEPLGFEVSGRVQFVIEPETNVDGQILFSESGQERNTTGTPLARIDTFRYDLNVESVQAQIKVTQKQIDAVRKEIEGVIPAQQRAAKASQAYRKSVYERSLSLYNQRQIQREELERDQATFEESQARVGQLESSLEAKVAEQESLEAKVEELQQSLKEAQQDVKDCVLVAPFFGQVAEVHTIPGGFVERGQPAVTVQMMDPIKIEFEASAETVRGIRHRDMVALHVPLADVANANLTGNVYMVDPVADPATRTFTVTILARNRRIGAAVPEEFRDTPTPRTEELHRIILNMPRFEGAQFIDQSCIQQDETGHFIWKVVNRAENSAATSSDVAEILKVEKVRVELGMRSVPFLDLWTFQEITFPDAQAFDIEKDVAVGELRLPEGVEAPWEGDTVLYDRQRWLLRPGDLVQLDLKGGLMPPGFYVPVNALRVDGDNRYVFTAADGAARRIPVRVFDGPDTLRRIEPVEEGGLKPGDALIAAGVHFLVDGEAVNVTSQVEVYP